jgi:general stress protein 26
MDTEHMHDATPTEVPPALARPDRQRIMRALTKRSYCTLATVSAAGRPHVAGVLYQLVDTTMWINTTASSRKARNVAHCRHVGVVVPVRRVPAGGPPSAVQFQAEADVVAVDHRDVVELVGERRLASITGHGELDLPGSCFIRVALPRKLHTYGLGMSLISLIRHPLEAAGMVELDRA